MQSLSSNSDLEIVSQVQLLKAIVHQKANLNYEISSLRIRKNYISSNIEYRDLKEVIALSKTLSKRLNELRQLNRSIKTSFPQELFPLILSEFSSTLQKTVFSPELQRNLFSLNFESETQVDILKEKYEALIDEYDTKVNQYKDQESVIDLSIGASETIELHEQEIFECKLQLEDLTAAISSLESKKIERSHARKNSFNAIKNYQKLSENALKLHSKLLIKQELNKNIIEAESDLEDLTKRITQSQELIPHLEKESQLQKTDFSNLNQELLTLKNSIKSHESQLHSLNSQKIDLLNTLLYKSSTHSPKDEEFEEEDTLNLPSWTTGFNQMQKDKEKLIAENQRLKDRISRLINS